MCLLFGYLKKSFFVGILFILFFCYAALTLADSALTPPSQSPGSEPVATDCFGGCGTTITCSNGANVTTYVTQGGGGVTQVTTNGSGQVTNVDISGIY